MRGTASRDIMRDDGLRHRAYRTMASEPFRGGAARGEPLPPLASIIPASLFPFAGDSTHRDVFDGYGASMPLFEMLLFIRLARRTPLDRYFRVTTIYQKFRITLFSLARFRFFFA